MTGFALCVGAAVAIVWGARRLFDEAGVVIERHVELALDEASEDVWWEDQAIALANEERTPIYEAVHMAMWEREMREEAS